MIVAPFGEGYRPRVVDDELAQVVGQLPAIAIEGAKAVGKTASALQHARTVHALDDPEQLEVAMADARRLLDGERPVLIDEWQRIPAAWDLVRRAVDAPGARAGSYLLTGSALPPPDATTHSGAARIVSVRMRPLTLAERGVAEPTVSLASLLRGNRPQLEGESQVRLDGYVREILASGFPGLRGLSGRPLRAQLDGYLDRLLDYDFGAAGGKVRNPAGLRRWLRAYAAASSLTASYETIRDAATGGEGQKPARSTTIPYRDVLERLWVLDPVEAWLPTRGHLRRLAAAPKHQLVDPALAARLVDVGAPALLGGDNVNPAIPRAGTFLGALFESLVTLDVRVYAQAVEARVKHLRTASGEHEIDLIVERSGGHGVLAVEVKLKSVVDEADFRHLRWLQDRLGDEFLDGVVVTTGTNAYRRRDGFGVVPAALLGP
jgi:predicted AAA+ superfamily ATPase